jgi:hypothetical protein
MKSFILLKPKLIQIDSILPLLFQLRAEGIEAKPNFIAPNRKTFDLIQRNPVLYDAIAHLGGTLQCLSNRKNRFLRVAANLPILFPYLLEKVISVETARDFSILTSLLSGFNRWVWKGKRVFCHLSNQPIRQYKAAVDSFVAITEVRTEKMVHGYDVVILSHDKEEFEETNDARIDSRSTVIRVGYTRGLESWRRYLEQRAADYFPEEVKGEYLFFAVPVMSGGVRGEENEPFDVLFEEALSVLREYNDRITTVFRPHPATDLKKMDAIIQRTGYRNYIVTYVHPTLMMSRAKFVMSIGATSLLSDAYFLKKATLEYSHYDHRYLEITGGQSLLFEHADHFINRNPQKLKETVDKLLDPDTPIVRDDEFIRKEFRLVGSEELRRQLGFFDSKA